MDILDKINEKLNWEVLVEGSLGTIEGQDALIRITGEIKAILRKNNIPTKTEKEIIGHLNKALNIYVKTVVK